MKFQISGEPNSKNGIPQDWCLCLRSFHLAHGESHFKVPPGADRGSHRPVGCFELSAQRRFCCGLFRPFTLPNHLADGFQASPVVPLPGPVDLGLPLSPCSSPCVHEFLDVEARGRGIVTAARAAEWIAPTRSEAGFRDGNGLPFCAAFSMTSSTCAGPPAQLSSWQSWLPS